MLTIREEFAPLLSRSEFSLEEIRHLKQFLEAKGTFIFPTLQSGLFAAASLSEGAEYTGYHNAWVRDTIHIAHAHWVIGRPDVARRSVMALSQFFNKHRYRFTTIIDGSADPSNPMNRPHVRFNGDLLEENDESWSHAQNDALGYFLWLYSKLALEGVIELDEQALSLLNLFPQYFLAVMYWEDEDNGHWEEARKVEASSIGAVVASLIEFQRLLQSRVSDSLVPSALRSSPKLVDELIVLGTTALQNILPMECAQPDVAKRREYDAALLFLIYPLNIVAPSMADQIIHNVETHLVGEYGVRRYLGDSFWCANYKDLQAPEQRTADVSCNMSERNALLQPGQEAQWCIFDPILSIIFGRSYLETGDAKFLKKQTFYLNRSLQQLTTADSGFEEFRCPELYYLDKDRYAPNDVTPLMWTQANLALALHQMELSLGLQPLVNLDCFL